MAVAGRKIAIRAAALVALALVLFAFVGVGQAQAQAQAYSVGDWAGCGGGYSAGSYDENGNLYVPCTAPGSANYSNSTIYKVGADGSRVAVSGVLPFHVTDVAPSPNGAYLYVAKAQSVPEPRWDFALNADRLKKVNGLFVEDTTFAFTGYGFDGATYPPQGMHIATDDHADGTHNVYIASGAWTADGNHTVAKYKSSGVWTGVNLGKAGPDKALASSWDPGVYKHNLTGLTVSPDGNRVYTVEAGNNRVQRWTKPAGSLETAAYAPNGSFGGKYKAGAPDPHVDRSGSCQSTWNSESTFSAPYDVALTNEGGTEYLYVLNTTCDQVMKFNATQAFTAGQGFVGAGQLGVPQSQPLPHGFAVSKSGDVYVGQSGKKWTRPVVPPPAAPDTSITGGPVEGSTDPDTTPTFTFASNPAGAGFQCKLDGAAAFTNCASPYTTPVLAARSHTLSVRAYNANGTDATPAVRTWTVGTASGETCDPTVNNGSGTLRMGDANSNRLEGDATNENLCGLGGDDTLSGGNGFDKMDGGSGTDTVSYFSANDAVVVNLGANSEAYDPSADGRALMGYDAPLKNIENAMGSDFADTLQGNEGNNRLTGANGADKFHAHGGDDVINASGDGADSIIDCGAGSDRAILDPDDVADANCEVKETPDTENPANGRVSIKGSAGSLPGYTRSAMVTLSLSATDNVGVTHMSFSSDNGGWQPKVAYSTAKSYTLPNTQGVRTVRVRFYDAGGRYTEAMSSIQLDSVVPAVVKVEPGAGLTGIRRTTAIVAHFSAPDLLDTSVADNSFSLRKTSNGVLVPMKSYTYSTDRNRAIMWPSAALSPNTQYTAYINARMTDKAGNYVKDQKPTVAGYQGKSWSFKTGL